MSRLEVDYKEHRYLIDDETKKVYIKYTYEKPVGDGTTELVTKWNDTAGNYFVFVKEYQAYLDSLPAPAEEVVEVKEKATAKK